MKVGRKKWKMGQKTDCIWGILGKLQYYLKIIYERC